MRYWFFIPFLLLVACHRTAPQAPSDGQVVDSAYLALIGINQRLALDADEELTHYAALHEGFVRDSTGIWILKTLRNPGGDTLAEQHPVQVDYVLWSLGDSTSGGREVKLGSGHKTAVLGKKEVPAALETAMRQMRDGESAVILAPWYQLYGREGKGHVEPYQQVRIELSVKHL